MRRISARVPLVLGALLCAGALLPAAADRGYSFTPIGPLALTPAPTSQSATCINDLGVIGFQVKLPAQPQNRSVLSDNGALTVFTPGGISGLNGDGVAVGFDPFNFTSWVRSSAGAVQGLAVPGASFTIAEGISDSGLIVGSYYSPQGEQGFLLRRGAYSSVAYPGAMATSLYGVNASGVAIGVFFDSQGVETAFTVDKKGAFQPLSIPGAVSSDGLAINNRGATAGYYRAPGEQPVGFVMEAGDLTTIDLSSELPASFVRGGFTFHLAPDTSFTQVVAINNHGDVIVRLEGDYDGTATGGGDGGSGGGHGGGSGGGPDGGHGDPPPPPGPTAHLHYSQDYLGTLHPIK